MTPVTSFFDHPQAAAVLKHGILKRYLRVFVTKTGSTAPGRRVGRMVGNRRLEGVPTEVLLNFSWSGLRRNAGHLTSESQDPLYVQQTRPTFIAKVNGALGGDWWQAPWRELPAGERERAITWEFLARLRRIPGGWQVAAVHVSDRWGGPIDYYLILLTQHPDGMWRFHEALSSAMEEYRQFCFEQSGELDFEPLPDREQQWINEIKRNIERLLDGGAFVVRYEMLRVFGAALTFGREKHVRQAIKQLHAEGRTPTDSKGNIQYKRLLPPSQPTLL